MVLRHALFLIGAIPLSLASPGCVGTLAGAPQASLAATEGTAAIGAFVQPSGAAFVDPASPGNVIVPAKPDLFIIDGSGTLSVLVPDSALSMASDLLSAAGPGSGVFVADSVSIRLLDYATNKLIVIAGNVTSEASASSAGDGSRALGSLIQPPICLYVDIVLGDVYFCDGRNVVRVVRAAGPAAGQLQTVAGDGSAARSVDGALANETGFSDLWDASLTPNGDLVIAENDGFQYPRILLLSRSSGRVRALAGSADTTATYSYTGPTNAGLFFDGAQALGTPLLGAVSVCVQPVSGAVFFSDGYRVISLTAAGTLRILAGRRQAAASLVIDGAPSIESTFSGVPLVRPGGKASLIVTDTGTAVYRIDLATGRMHVVAGPALHEDITPASLQGGVFATSLTLPRNSLEDIAVDETGDVFLPILSANVILRVFAANGTASVIAGSGSPACTADGISDATAVGVPSVTGVALDGRGGLVFTERDCCLVLRLNLSNSALSILAGGDDCEVLVRDRSPPTHFPCRKYFVVLRRPVRVKSAVFTRITRGPRPISG